MAGRHRGRSVRLLVGHTCGIRGEEEREECLCSCSASFSFLSSLQSTSGYPHFSYLYKLHHRHAWREVSTLILNLTVRL